MKVANLPDFVFIRLRQTGSLQLEWRLSKVRCRIEYEFCHVRLSQRLFGVTLATTSRLDRVFSGITGETLRRTG